MLFRSIKEWYDGNIIAPRDWRDFNALAQLPSEDAEEFGRFYQDFLNSPDQEFSVDNRYHAYWLVVTYRQQRFCLGKEAALKRGKRSKSSEKKINVDMDELKEYIRKNYLGDVVNGTAIVPVISIETLTGGSSSTRSTTRTKPLLRNGVWIAKEDDNFGLEKKSIADIIRDTQIVERSFFHQVSRYVINQYKANIDEFSLLMRYIEDRIRGVEWEKRQYIYKMSRETVNDIKEIACDVHTALMNGTLDEILEFPKGSFRKLVKVHSKLQKAYPPELEEEDMLSDKKATLEELSKSHGKRQKNQFRKEISDISKRLKQLKKATTRYRLHTKLMIGELLPSAGIVTVEDLQQTGRLAKIMGMNELDKKSFYSADDITNVLTSYGLEVFIEHNLEILLYNIFVNSIS